MRRKSIGVVIFPAILLGAVSASPQHKPEQKNSTPKFTARAELVLVPVVVTDKQGARVGGLAAEDFTLLEDGKPKAVAFFSEIKTSPAMLRAPQLPPGEFTNALVTPEAGRITIILLDMLNTRVVEQVRVRRETLKLLSQALQPGEPVVLLTLTPGGLRVIHDFTTDPSVLAEALKKLHPIPSTEERIESQVADKPLAGFSQRSLWMIAQAQGSLEGFETGAMDQYEGTDYRHLDRPIRAFNEAMALERESDFAATLQVLRAIADGVAGIPGRKTLIWATGGLPAIMDKPNSLRYFSGDLVLYRQTWAALGHANISVYPLDLSPLVSPAWVSATMDRPSSQYRSYSGPPTNLKEFAEITGGRLCIAKLDMGNCFLLAAQDAANYYSLAYYTDTRSDPGGWRRITVKLKNPRLQVHARSGFFPRPTGRDEPPERAVEIRSAMQSPLDSTGVLFGVRWTGQHRAADHTEVGFRVHLAGDAVSVAEDASQQLQLEIGALAKNGQGKAAADVSRSIAASLEPATVAAIKRVGVDYDGSLQLPSGEYMVRFFVRDLLSGRVGTVSAPLKVE